MKNQPYRLLEAVGIELEYMIVDRDDLSVKPIADAVLARCAPSAQSTAAVDWSNELVLHVMEMKTPQPVDAPQHYLSLLPSEITRVNTVLDTFGAKLLPTGAHPLMDPFTETRLWPHSNREIYEAYNGIFDCRGHGWSNVQSTHVNVSFATDEEFSRLHAAIRMILPLLPALSASSPLIDGNVTGAYDTRLVYYGQNQKKIPSIAGEIIPEGGIRSPRDYEEKILRRMYRDIAGFDPQGILQDEWLNSRGAIARFERSAIEIRILDTQECITAETALCALIWGLLRMLVSEETMSCARQLSWPQAPLVRLYEQVIRRGRHAEIDDTAYGPALGCRKTSAVTVHKVWDQIITLLVNRGYVANDPFGRVYETWLSRGSLAERIVRALDADRSARHIRQVYHRLAECLARNTMFMELS